MQNVVQRLQKSKQKNPSLELDLSGCPILAQVELLDLILTVLKRYQNSSENQKTLRVLTSLSVVRLRKYLPSLLINFQLQEENLHLHTPAIYVKLLYYGPGQEKPAISSSMMEQKEKFSSTQYKWVSSIPQEFLLSSRLTSE